MRFFLGFIFLSILSWGAWAQLQPNGLAQSQLPRTKLQAGMYLIDVQVAQTPEQRAIGLMYRTDLGTNEGMLFVFPNPAIQCFWMKNTLIPLTAAFLDDTGRIVNLADMKPQTETNHCSKAPVRYVLEMEQGWFHKRSIKASMHLSGMVFDTKKEVKGTP